jgi:PhnB protein
MTDSSDGIRGIEPELWVDRGAAAVAFYRAAFGAVVLHLVGEGEDIVAQLQVGAARFWVAGTQSGGERLTPTGASGATGRTLLVADDPDGVVERAVQAGAKLLAEVAEEHGWRLGRIRDPAGHEWEIGHPTGDWPPGS